MELYCKKKFPYHFIMTSQPRRVYDLEESEINSIFWLRERNREISDYLESINLTSLPKSFVISNALEDSKIDRFFRNFPKDHDEFRKGHEKIQEDITNMLKMITALNPKRYLEVSIITNPSTELEKDYSESEINLICSYLNPGMQWIENTSNDKTRNHNLGVNEVAIFKGKNFPGSLSPLKFNIKKEAKFLIYIKSYLAEH